MCQCPFFLIHIQRYLKHLIRLIDATHILCSSNISFEKLDEADKLLNTFVDDFELLYGEYKMVFNVHLLKHLANCVKFIGPLFCYSNYNFEDHIGHLVGMHKGTTDVTSQISEKYLLEKCIFHYLDQSSVFRDYYENINSKHRYKTSRKIAGSLVIGNKKKRLSGQEKLLIVDSLNLPNISEVEEYDSMLLNNKVYNEIESITLHKKTNDSFVFNTENKSFAVIESIFVINEKIYILANEKFEQIISNERNHCKSNIFLKTIDFDRKNIYEVKFIGPKFALIQFNETIACSAFPNMIERN